LAKIKGMPLLARISRDQALEIARQECERRDWPWVEPVLIKRRLLSYSGDNEPRADRGNVFMELSARSGSVLSAGFARR
jgi:hypothetical protein